MILVNYSTCSNHVHEAAAVLLRYRVYQLSLVDEQQGMVAAGAVQKLWQPVWLSLPFTLPFLALAPPHCLQALLLARLERPCPWSGKP